MSEDNGNEGYDSGVEGVKADDIYKGDPVFDLDSKSFFDNMRKDRNHMSFPDDSKPSKFMKATTHRKTFYISYKDKNGEKYLSKVK